MDNQQKKPTRKAHDINTQIEEENLWDLEDDWEGADEETEEIPEVTPPAVKAEKSETEQEEKLSETKNEAAQENEDPVVPNAETENTKKNEPESEPESGSKSLDSPKEEQEKPVDVKPVDVKADSESEPAAEAATVAESSDVDVVELASPLNKLSLSSAEKVTLSAIALLFIGLTIWGVVWLKQKNPQSMTGDSLKLPLKGDYATVSGLTTYWKPAGNAPGIKLGAAIVPAANISLDEQSTSGALRIYFKNAQGDRVGDTITVSFTDGQFENGTDTIEVSASDGFHLKGDFHAYQMDSSLAWTMILLEAADRSANSSAFKELTETKMAPAMR